MRRRVALTLAGILLAVAPTGVRNGGDGAAASASELARAVVL